MSKKTHQTLKTYGLLMVKYFQKSHNTLSTRRHHNSKFVITQVFHWKIPQTVKTYGNFLWYFSGGKMDCYIFDVIVHGHPINSKLLAPEALVLVRNFLILQPSKSDIYNDGEPWHYAHRFISVYVICQIFFLFDKK